MTKKQKKTLHYLVFFWLVLTVIVPVMAAVPGDIVYDREDQSEVAVFPPSIFQHWKHRINYRCDACHDSLFEMKKGATPVTMEMINNGQVCGTCHNGSIAFSSDYTHCERCHTLPAE